MEGVQEAGIKEVTTSQWGAESGMGIRYGNQVWGGRGAGVGRMDEQAQRMSEVGERGG